MTATPSLEKARLVEQLDHVERDRVEVAEQELVGELDAGVVSALRATLDEEASAIAEALAGVAQSGPADPVASNRRAKAGIWFLVAGAVAIGATLMLTTDEGGDGGIVDAPSIDLASITSDRLEEVIAANPDVVPMRLFLAQMLTEEGELLRAARHLGEVLGREENNPEALALLGWISFLVEEHETAESYLVDALTVAPDYPQAQWWLANVRFLGLGDAAGAIEPLEDLVASDDVPADVRQGAELMLQAAREDT